MKKLLKSIPRKLITSIIIITLCIGSVFANVPQKDFDEVYNQLVISNEALKEAVLVAEGLREVVKERNIQISHITIERDSFQSQLYDKDEIIKTLETEKQEILDRLIISNEQIKKDIITMDTLNITIGNLQTRLKESNLLITRRVKYSVGGGVVASTGGLGGQINFSYLFLKNMGINTSIAVIQNGTFIANAGLSFYW